MSDDLQVAQSLVEMRKKDAVRSDKNNNVICIDSSNEEDFIINAFKGSPKAFGTVGNEDMCMVDKSNFGMALGCEC